MEAKTAYAKSKRSRRRIGCAPPGGGAPAPEDRDAPDPADDREQAAPLRGGRRGAASSPTRASWGVWRGPGRAVRRHPDVRVGSPLNRASWGVWRGPGRAARRHPDVRVGSPLNRASWGVWRGPGRAVRRHPDVPGRVAPESRLLGRLARSRTGGAASSRCPGRIVPDSRLLGRLRRMPAAPSAAVRQMPAAPSAAVRQMPAAPSAAFRQMPAAPSAAFRQMPAAPSAAVRQMPAAPSVVFRRTLLHRIQQTPARKHLARGRILW